ncbi:hypothetical protein M0R45_028076 [Rubus argutus]|uniref:F-box domain-containing protein n=1 Tax=Rubus argutus TaxID=59490 RepID=A0AAW1W889_RUBAR
MGNIFSHCFTHKQEGSDRWIREEEEGNKHHEQRNSTASAVDRISDLPDDILLLILALLPLKSVGQTSVLSRRWIHVWSSYPIFDFYDIFTGNEAVHHQTRARIINTVLARHDETYNIMYPCLKLSLPRFGWDPNDSYCLPRVEELVLDISLSSENTSDLPQCQLKCHSLRSDSCGNSKAWLGFPSSYVVGSYLRSLQALSLINVDFLESAWGVDLFSGSSFPFLEKLDIQRCRGVSDLKISCPNLKDIRVFAMDLNSMDISGMRLEKLSVLCCFKNCINGSWVNIFAPNLQNFSWNSNDITEKCSFQSFPALKTSNLSYLFPSRFTSKINKNHLVHHLSCSSQVEDLTICFDYLQILSEIYFELGGLPFSFSKLKTLTVWLPFKNECIPGIACLFKSSPVVHTLDIYFWASIEGNNILLDDANCSTQEQYWETQAQYLIPFLSHLKVVNIGLHDTIPENAITFAKFVLKYGRGLQRLILRFIGSNSSLPPNSLNDTIALIEGLPRASADVKFSTLR